MNFRQWLAHRAAEIRGRFGIGPWQQTKKRYRETSLRANWRKLLKMDLGEAFGKIAARLRAPSAIHAIKFDAPASWPIWFRSITLATLFIATLAIVAYPFWSDGLGELRRKQAESNEQMARYRHLAAEVALLDAYRDRVTALDMGFGELLELIPAELEVVQVLNQFSQIARTSGVRLELFKPEAEIRGEAYAILPASMQLSGSFGAIVRFLEAVSGMKHLVTVDVVIESNPSTPGKNQLIARVKAYRGDSTVQKRSGMHAGGGTGAYH
jgi:type IV pilus assembly protein PilO